MTPCRRTRRRWIAGRRLIVSSAIPSTSFSAKHIITRIRGKSIPLSRKETLGDIIIRKNTLRRNILRKNTLISFPKHKPSTLLFIQTTIPASHTVHNVETHPKHLLTHSISQTTHVPFAHDKRRTRTHRLTAPRILPHPPFHRSQARTTPHPGQAQVGHQAFFHGRRSRRRLHIQRERGIHVVDEDRRRCRRLRTLARLMSQTNNIQKSTSPSSLLGLGAGTAPHLTTTPHTTTSTIQTSTHPSLHPTSTTPLATNRSSTQLTSPTTSPGTSLPTPPPRTTTQLPPANSYHGAPTHPNTTPHHSTPSSKKSASACSSANSAHTKRDQAIS